MIFFLFFYLLFIIIAILGSINHEWAVITIRIILSIFSLLILRVIIGLILESRKKREKRLRYFTFIRECIDIPSANISKINISDLTENYPWNIKIVKRFRDFIFLSDLEGREFELENANKENILIFSKALLRDMRRFQLFCRQELPDIIKQNFISLYMSQFKQDFLNEDMRSWQKLRVFIWERDKRRCVLCEDNLNCNEWHSHHLKMRSENGSDTLGNLVTLCKNCHFTFPKHEKVFFGAPLEKITSERIKQNNKIIKKIYTRTPNLVLKALEKSQSQNPLLKIPEPASFIINEEEIVNRFLDKVLLVE